MASNKTHLYVVPNKNRLYVTVYPDDDVPDDKESFSWGFLIGPKHEDTVINPGVRYYIDRSPLPATSEHPDGGGGGGGGSGPGGPGGPGGRSFRWRYAEDALPSIKCPARMYARILIAKIEDEDRLERLLRETPRPRAPEDAEDDPVAAALYAGYDSQVWAAQVLERLADVSRKRGDRIVGAAVLDWQRIEQTARRYVAGKMAADRYNEDYLRETQHRLPKPTWDMLLDREVAG